MNEKGSTHIKVTYYPKVKFGRKHMKNTCSTCNSCCHTGEEIKDTDFGYTLSMINGKYKLIIIYWLSMHQSIMRYNELKKCLGSISHKTLSSTLKEMEADGLIIRKEYPQIPPKVEYSLSERGESLVPILVAMCDWGGKHRADA